MFNAYAQRLREVAHHEAAHAEIAQLLTARPATVTLTASPGDGAIRGSCTYEPSSNHDHQVAISLAGAIAQVAVRPDAAGLRGAAWYREVAAAISDGDTANIGGRFSREDVDRVAALVSKNWSRIEMRAGLEITKFTQAQSAPASQAAATTRGAQAPAFDPAAWRALKLAARTDPRQRARVEATADELVMFRGECQPRWYASARHRGAETMTWREFSAS